MHRLRTLALAGLAAGLMAGPAFAEPAAAAVNTGNTTWLLVSAALVMLMTPGLAFFYAGMVSHKNVVSTLLQNYVVLTLIGLIWIVCGYSLVFTEGSGLIGGFDHVMLQGLHGNLYSDASGVPLMAFMAFQMMFAIITPALITGSIAERVNFSAWLLIMALWSLAVYIPVAHWVWGPDGWILKKGGLDFAGGLVVHITAGFSGLVAALLFGKRLHKGEHLPNDIPMVMLGAALLWFGWFGFNAGSAITAEGLAAHAFVLTFIGGSVAFLVWMLVDWIRIGKPTAMGAATGIVVGLVTITPAAGFVSVEHAILMCAVSAVICNLVAAWLKGLTHLDDALDVFACHGLGGLLGAVMTGVFASSAINPAVTVQGIAISGETGLFMANLTGAAVVAAFSMAATFIIIKVVNVFTKVRVSDEQQTRGLDVSMHGEVAKVGA